jgi:hypothetical protein
VQRELGIMAHTCNPSYLKILIGRILVQGQPWQKLAVPYPTNKPCMVVHFCNLNYVGSINRRTVLPGQSGQKVRPYLKITKAKSAGGVAQVVDLPPSKCKAMSSNPSTEKKKKRWCKGSKHGDAHL